MDITQDTFTPLGATEKYNGIAKKKWICRDKDSFSTQDRNEDFEGEQVESTFSRGQCDLGEQFSNSRRQMKDMDIILDIP